MQRKAQGADDHGTYILRVVGQLLAEDLGQRANDLPVVPRIAWHRHRSLRGRQAVVFDIRRPLSAFDQT